MELPSHRLEKELAFPKERPLDVQLVGMPGRVAVVRSLRISETRTTHPRMEREFHEHHDHNRLVRGTRHNANDILGEQDFGGRDALGRGHTGHGAVGIKHAVLGADIVCLAW